MSQLSSAVQIFAMNSISFVSQPPVQYFPWGGHRRPPLLSSFRKPHPSQRQTIAMASIEVERKFRVTPLIRSSLVLRTHATKRFSFEDCYFDEHLASRDMWLRKRNDTWELKIPINSTAQKSSAETVYRELTGSAVWRELGDDSIERESLLEYARLKTDRMEFQFKWRSYQVSIVLDACTSEDGFQYDVGEIEVLVDDDCEVEAASRALAEVSLEYGIGEMHQCEGKLLRYLREKRMPLFERLQKTGVIP